MTASDDEVDCWNAVQLHEIFIDDGKDHASRQFAAGVYQDRKESIPPEFAAIELILQRIGKAAEGKPCRMAPGIKLPSFELHPPGDSSS